VGAWKNAWGGEDFSSPRSHSYRITDVAEAIRTGMPPGRIVGIRPGEKVHEEMITINDGYNTIDPRSLLCHPAGPRAKDGRKCGGRRI